MITMSILKNIRITLNFRVLFFLNIFMIIFSMWIYFPHDDVFTYRRTIEDQNKRGIRLNICFKRYLAEFKGETEIDQTGLYNNAPYYFENKGTSNYDDNVSIYGNIKNRDSNKLKLYKTAYKHRYAKKKGLSKLDCYYEKKIFDIIDHIKVRAKSMRNDKNTYNKYIYRKFAIRFIIFALFPLLGIIIPILFGDKDPEKRIVSWTIHKCRNKAEGGYCKRGFIHFSKGQRDAIAYLNIIFILALTIIFLLTVTYIFIKIIKYERLKLGKGKMNRKEYINFCKNVFKTKLCE